MSFGAWMGISAVISVLPVENTRLSFGYEALSWSISVTSLRFSTSNGSGGVGARYFSGNRTVLNPSKAARFNRPLSMLVAVE